MKYTQIKDFTRWITDDRFLGQWYVSDCEWVNIRKSSRWVVLSNNYRTVYTLWTTWGIISSFWNSLISWTKRTILCQWYKIFNTYNNKEVYSNINITDADFMLNLWTIWNYWYAITNLYLNRWDNSTWLITSNIVNEPLFWSTWSWTVWTWWTIWSNKASHTSWTAVLSQNLTSSNGKRHILYIRWSKTSGTSLTINVWWATLWTITNNWSFDVTYHFTWDWSDLLEFIPTTDFVWYVDQSYCYPSTMEEQYVSLSSRSDFRPVLYDGWMLYVWWDWTIDAIDTTLSVWTVVYTCTFNWNCRALTKIWDLIYAYLNDWINWYKISRDWISELPLYSQKWADNPVINVANMGNYDYIITGIGEFDENKYRRMWYSEGWNKTLMYWSDYINYSKQLLNFNPFNTNAIETLNNIVFIPSIDTIYWYWNIKASLKTSLSKDIVIPNSDRISALYVLDQSNVYVWYYEEDGWTTTFKYFKQDIRDWYAYWTNWYICTLSWDWWDIETKKTLNRIVVWYKLDKYQTYTTSLDVSIKIDNNKYWVFDYSSISILPMIWDTYSYNWLTYTIYKIQNNQIICTKDENWPQYDNIIGNSWTLTKSTWLWDTTISFSKVDNYIYVGTIDDATKNKETLKITESYNEVIVKVDLISENETITPTLYSIKILFDYDKLDVW